MANSLIKFNCIGYKSFNLEDFKILQGELKSCSDEDFEKLKKSIISHGVIAPFYAWQDKNNMLWIVDATQRHKMLTILKSEGFNIPKIPTVLIEAENKIDAKNKLLIINSSYGKITREGLEQFLTEEDSPINLNSISEFISIPEIDIIINLPDNYSNDDLSDFFSEHTGAESPQKIKLCPHCGKEI
jgi:hypothetical protein